MRTLIRLILLAFCLFLVGCASNNVLDPDAEHFAGLDPAVVAEVLSNPIERSRIERKPSDSQKNLAQVRVIAFIMCRDVLRVYQEWLNSGYTHNLREQPTPTYKEEGDYTWDYDYENFENSIASGNIEELRDRLTQEGSCGRSVPRQPGDIYGPTIADVVLGRGT